MRADDRRDKQELLIALAMVAVWALLCFLVLISPRMRALNRVQEQVTEKSRQLAEMKREIEDARIAGGPAPGEGRFDKFGILARNEESLFLRDLIQFCKDTRNTLNLVRRAQYTRRAPASDEEVQAQRPGGGGTAAGRQKSDEQPRPTIDRVPHTVSFSGTFLSAFYLLRRLESYRRLMTVERVDLMTDTKEGYPRLRGDITIDLYLARVPSAERGGSRVTGGGPPPGSQAGITASTGGTQ